LRDELVGNSGAFDDDLKASGGDIFTDLAEEPALEGSILDCEDRPEVLEVLEHGGVERLQETDGAELYDGLDRESLEYGFFPEEDFYLDETGNPVFYLEPGFAKDGGEPLLFPISIEEILDEM
jgi:hypothetical protein